MEHNYYKIPSGREVEILDIDSCRFNLKAAGINPDDVDLSHCNNKCVVERGRFLNLYKGAKPIYVYEGYDEENDKSFIIPKECISYHYKPKYSVGDKVKLKDLTRLSEFISNKEIIDNAGQEVVIELIHKNFYKNLFETDIYEILDGCTVTGCVFEEKNESILPERKYELGEHVYFDKDYLRYINRNITVNVNGHNEYDTIFDYYYSEKWNMWFYMLKLNNVYYTEDMLDTNLDLNIEKDINHNDEFVYTEKTVGNVDKKINKNINRKEMKKKSMFDGMLSKMKERFIPVEESDVKLSMNCEVVVSVKGNNISIDKDNKPIEYPDDFTFPVPVYSILKPISKLKQRDVIKVNDQFYKIISISKNNELNCLSYSGKKTTNIIPKDFIMNGSFVRVIFNMFETDDNQGMNQMMMYYMLGNKDSDDREYDDDDDDYSDKKFSMNNMFELMMMQNFMKNGNNRDNKECGIFGNMNPMMFAMMNKSKGSSMFENMMMMQMMNNSGGFNGMFDNMFGSNKNDSESEK